MESVVFRNTKMTVDLPPGSLFFSVKLLYPRGVNKREDTAFFFIKIAPGGGISHEGKHPK